MKLKCLAIYPNQWGFGYAMFNKSNELVDFGVKYIQPSNDAKTLKACGDMIARFKPNVVISRDFVHGDRSSARIQKLTHQICERTNNNSFSVERYSRKEIRRSFERFDVQSKQKIAEKLWSWFSELSPYSFPQRKRWEPEHYNFGIFDAVSLAMVYYDKEM